MSKTNEATGRFERALERMIRKIARETVQAELDLRLVRNVTMVRRMCLTRSGRMLPKLVVESGTASLRGSRTASEKGGAA